MSTSNKRTAEAGVTQADLGDHKGENGKLEVVLDKIADRINRDSEGSYIAAEWLGWVLNNVVWVSSKLSRGVKWAFRRLSSYNERMATASKTRNEGKALWLAAKGEAAVKFAEARKINAEAREKELETAIELLQELKNRGIDFTAVVKDGELHIGVVKDQVLGTPPPSDVATTPTKKKRSREPKPKD